MARDKTGLYRLAEYRSARMAERALQRLEADPSPRNRELAAQRVSELAWGVARDDGATRAECYSASAIVGDAIRNA